MGEIRDAARTRQAILEAARDEFAERGYAGGRIEQIARRAGVSKQLVIHHFPNKSVLFEQTVEMKFSHHRPVEIADDGPGARFRQRFETSVRDKVWQRFLLWEAAAQNLDRPIMAEKPRKSAVARQIAEVKEAQAKGDLPADMSPKMLVLLMNALATYPLVFEQVTQMIVGRLPDDPRFKREWLAFLDQLAERLARNT